jgi:hypothetical protein
MSEQPDDQHWFISRGGKRYGPYTYGALLAAAENGIIDGDTNVWRLGWQRWHPARNVPGLIDEPPKREDAGEDSIEGLLAGHEEEAAGHAADHPTSRDTGEQPRDDHEGRRPLAARTSPIGDDIVDDGEPRPLSARKHPLDDDDAVAHPIATRTVPSEEGDEATLALPKRDKPSDVDADLAARADRDRLLPDLDFAPARDRLVPRVDLDVAPRRDADRATVLEVPGKPPGKFTERAAAPKRRSGKRLVVGIAAVLLAGGAGWGIFQSGLIAVVPTAPAGRPAAAPAQTPEPTPVPASAPASAPQSAPAERTPPPARATGTDLPDAVAELSAVAALQRGDPNSFATFRKRFAESAVNAPDDQLLSIARSALRKSVKRQLANAPADTLVEITEAYVGYMQALQFSSPESCVALSDEGKGAKMTSNLAKDFPALFARDMAVLARIAAADPATVVKPMTADQARPLLETVFKRLREQPVQSDLLGRDKLNPPEYLSYCTLVIAFYENVLALPNQDRVNLLRYLYATAATE